MDLLYVWHNWCDCYAPLHRNSIRSSTTFIKKTTTISWFARMFHYRKRCTQRHFLPSWKLPLSPLTHAERLMLSSLLSKSPLPMWPKMIQQHNDSDPIRGTKDIFSLIKTDKILILPYSFVICTLMSLLQGHICKINMHIFLMNFMCSNVEMCL